jgi:hypothetical protein
MALAPFSFSFLGKKNGGKKKEKERGEPSLALLQVFLEPSRRGCFFFGGKERNKKTPGGVIPAHSLAAENPIHSGRLHLMKSKVRVSTETPLLWNTEEPRERSRRPFAVGF